jgi:predicted HicB family RNase H-like nuclease
MQKILPPEYNARIHLIATQPLVAAVTSAAHRNLISINAYVRRALMNQLKEDGIKVDAA